MNVLVAVDAQLYRTKDGKIWTRTIYDYEFWTRYLDVFDTIVVASRLMDVDDSYVENFLRSDGQGVLFKALPMAIGSSEYIKRFFSILKAANNAVRNVDCAIIRLPSISAMIIECLFRFKHKPYCLEIVVDPQKAYVENPIVSKLISAHLKRACKKANGVAYVTQFALQKLYPCKSILDNKQSDEYFDSYYSSINLSRSFFSAQKMYDKVNSISLVHTANNVNNYVKGHDVVIKVVKKLNDMGINADITFIGDGNKRAEFELLANQLDISDKVNFTGLLNSKEEIRNELIKADMFIFPTKCEGLPRALIEAMAVGLPCISTPVNGIPELLDEKYMFDPLDVDGFAEKIEYLIRHKTEMLEMSKKNIMKAEEYESTILQQRRNEFYRKLKKIVK